MLVRARWMLAVLSLYVSACDCDHEGGKVVLYSGGKTENGVYQTSEVWGPWLDFPGGRRFMLVHGLGRQPSRVMSYLAFSERPFDGGESQVGNRDGGASFSQSAGDSTLVERMDDQYIVVLNSTCTGFYLRVVAEAGPDGTSVDAGTD